MKLKAILTYASDENDIFKIIKNLTLFIKNYVNENIMFQDMIKKIGLTLDIPKSIIEKRLNEISNPMSKKDIERLLTIDLSQS